MMTTLNANLIALIKQIIARMVAGDFDAVEQQAGGVRLSAAEMAAAVNNYGRTLTMRKRSIDHALALGCPLRQ